MSKKSSGFLLELECSLPCEFPIGKPNPKSARFLTISCAIIPER